MIDTTDTSVVGILGRLISFPTVSGPTEEMSACFDYVESILSEHGMHVQRHNSNGFPSLIATSRDTTCPKVLLQAHLDVVPADPTFYSLQEKGGKLYGRGSFDMKFAAACYIALVRSLGATLQDYSFGIMFTSDEEIGGKNGVNYLLNNGYGR
jgi:succinyl-diaminopimelate desuccinylase